MDNLTEDPWGNAYVVNAGGLKPGLNPVLAGYVLSAGPNGIIETKTDQSIGSGSPSFEVKADDVHARIR